MAQTPFVDVKSEDILSAHISGIQHAVNKVESVLNMKTATVTGHTLNAVADQDDAGLHRYVYEGTIRNWLISPAPVVKRNGVTVASSEYTLKAPYGTIVFNAQQAAGDTITADFTYVTNDSTVIDDLDSRLTDNESETAALGSRVTTLEAGGSGGGGGLSAYPTAMLAPKNAWVSNNKDSTATAATNVLISGNSIDAFPIMLSESVTIDQLKVLVGANNTKAANVILGIYSNQNAQPKTLLAETNLFRCELANNGTALTQALKTGNLTLGPGVYWLARYANDGVSFDGWNQSGLFDFYEPDATYVDGTSGKVAGIRYTGTGSLSAMPASIPTVNTTNVKYLKRTTFGAVYAHTV